MNNLRAAGVAVLVAIGTVAAPTAARAGASGSGTITDPVLLQELAQLHRANTNTKGPSASTIQVEVATNHDTTVAAAVRRLGGAVTGEVPGAVVQARVPVAQLARIAGMSSVVDVRAPRHANPRPAPLLRRARPNSTTGTGPTQGSEVVLTNAASWQSAGLTGSGVKIGVVDYFNITGYWNPAEMGPVPDATHQFCLDSAPDPNFALLCTGSLINSSAGAEHGPAVVEILRDMAPGADVFVASVDTASDLRAAVDWFHSHGVTIITRSLGSSYEGPGDGTGPLDSVVDYAASLGITWFNSAGNDGIDEYMRRSVPKTLARGGYVNFNDGRPGVPAGSDTWLRLDVFGCGALSGVRWANDWNLPAAQRSDYQVLLYEPTVAPPSDHWNPGTGQYVALPVLDGPGAGGNIIDANQKAGAAPLEGADSAFCPTNTFGPVFDAQGDRLSVAYLRVRLKNVTGNSVGTTPDTLEILMADGLLEINYSDTAMSAQRPIVDSQNPAAVAVGAIDLSQDPTNTTIASYSSQGPTNTGWMKPDITAPSGFFSSVYSQAPFNDVFSGTSSSSPTAAGAAALLAGAGLAAGGQGLADLVRHFTADKGPPGPDSTYGTGEVLLPAPPPPAAAVTPGKYVGLRVPQRLVDTRSGPSHIGAFTGPFSPGAVLDQPVLGQVGVPSSGVSAVVVNVTSVGSALPGFVQAFPYLRGSNGSTSTLNLAVAGVTQPNFAIVPLGVDGKISLYLQAGGQVLVDVMGYFLAGETTTTDGRYVPLATPERWMDTRSGPLPDSFSSVARQVNAGETVTVPNLATSAINGVMATEVKALVVNVTATRTTGQGWLTALPDLVDPATLTYSTVNYTAGVSSANIAVVPLGTDGNIAVQASRQATDVIVDVIGYITSSGAASSDAGLFTPVTPTRVYDTRGANAPSFTAPETRAVNVNPGGTLLPAGGAAVSLNVTVAHPTVGGYLTVYGGAQAPATSSLNFGAGRVVANAVLSTSPSYLVNVAMGSGAGDVLIDVNGWFSAGSA